MNYTEIQTVDGRSPSRIRRLAGFLIAVMSFAALAATASAQNATITGHVLNSSTGEFLKYAQIQVVGTDRVAFSEEGGQFKLTNVPAGQAKLITTYTGLDPLEIVVTVPAEGSVTQEIVLTSAEYGETVKLGVFRVASAREGNAKAIVEQRIALNLKTVIAADAFGDVAEGNVGEFLKLLPGVSVDYVDNDVRSTRIRGLPPKYVTTTLDGLPISNSGSNNLSATGQGRYTELEQLSMAALDVVETTKTPTSDLVSSNLAGNVNAISKSAFNQKGRSIKYSGNVNFNQWFASFEKSKGWDNQSHNKALPGGKIEWIDTFLNGRLGTVVSVAHSGAFADQRVVIGTYVWDRNATNNSAELPLLNNWNFQDGLKPTWRDSLLFNVDFKATDELKLSLRTNYGYYRSEFYNRNWQAVANTGNMTAYGTDGTLTPTALSTGLINRTETSGTSLGAVYLSGAGTTCLCEVLQNTVNVLGSNQRKSGGTLNISPAASWKRDNIKADVTTMYSIGKTAYTSGQDGFFSLVSASMPNVAFDYNRISDDNVQIIQRSLPSGTAGAPAAVIAVMPAVSNQGSIFDLGNYNINGLAEQTTRNSKAQTWSGRGDVEIAYPEWSIPTTFKLGGSGSLEVRDVHTLQAKWTMALVSNSGLPTSATVINLQDFRDPYAGGVGTVTDINGVTAKTPGADK
ncbi:MAG: carboxypeptidase-like regulatory domain-containing protein [Verrucomicrobia bacterium]|nr:carboxypeptidase-like regulatory domain-containing protein [Verrucomicrobiota bacterium]